MKKYSTQYTAQSLAQLMIAKNIDTVIVSPGSRNAPLITTFDSFETIKTYSIVDERCAGFIGLGIAIEKKRPVVLCCTSGSALLNYYPAIAEAFYQSIPLIVISADRPQNQIDQSVGQTIRQADVFANHIKKSVQLIDSNEVSSMKYNDRLINEALNEALIHQLPVHINIPFSEPFYATTPVLEYIPKVIKCSIAKKSLDLQLFEDFLQHWNMPNQKKMILVGMQTNNKELEMLLTSINNDPSVIILHENTSNCFIDNSINTIDQTIFSLNKETLEEIHPTLLITIGKNYISKKLIQFLTQNKPVIHASLGENEIVDTFESLTHHFDCDIINFLQKLNQDTTYQTFNYKDCWAKIVDEKRHKHHQFLQDTGFSDLKVMEKIMEKTPKNSILHFSNSMVVRYSQLFTAKESLNYYANRGTSGIDGSTSTAFGFAISSQQKNILITGDISFLYDSNALWNNYLPDNLVVIIFNNGGGEIFKFIPGPDKTNAIETFTTPHQFNYQSLADMYNFDYQLINNLDDLNNTLPSLFTHPKKILIEIDTQGKNNAQIMRDYFDYLA